MQERLMSTNDIYATPRVVTSLEDCSFYHVMEVPGYGLVKGAWDLRAGAQDYLGNVDFKGKRVLEMGAASGFLTFTMEKQGAEVVAYDLSEDQEWDIVPYAGEDYRQRIQDRKAHIRKLNNGFWLSHRAFESKAKMVHGTVYAVPEAIGPVDIATFGCILLHLRDPFHALYNALRLTRETVVITETLPPRALLRWLWRLDPRGWILPMTFLPNPTTHSPQETWWRMSPHVLKKFIGVLGFEKTELTYHTQFKGTKQPLYTIVGHRTRSL